MQKTPPDSPIRLMLVEDDIHFQGALAAALDGRDDVKLIGVASTCEQAIQALNGPPVDVLLVDLGLPDGSGIDVIRAAHTLWPACSIMVSTVFCDESHILESIEAGANGYLLKDSAAGKIVEEIRSVHCGGSPISPLIARQILSRFRQSDSRVVSNTQVARGMPRTLQAPLSAREGEVLELVTRGFTQNEIATMMQVSRNTVQTFVRRIYSKLNVGSKAEAIYEARIQGMSEI